MYLVIGADGKQYGPVAPDLVRNWIAQGRLNPSSRIRPTESPDWVTLNQLPEFAPDLTARTADFNSGQPGAPVDAAAYAQQIITRNYRIRVGDCLGRGWTLVTANFWPSIGAGLLVTLLILAVNAIPFAGLALTYVFLAGLDWYFLKQIRGQPAEIGDIFSVFQKHFVPLMLFSVVGQLLTAVGLLCCLIPGIYLAIVWLMFPPLLIIDKNLDFWPAMELSRKVVNHHFGAFFLLNLAAFLILLAASLVCIGFLLAFPVITAASVHAYEDVFGDTPPLPARTA